MMAEISYGGVSGNQLRALVERIEFLEGEKSKVMDLIKDVYKEASGTGFDVGTMRSIIRLRKMDKSKFAEQQELLDLYMHALGMVAENSDEIAA
jgi:uncharacterized protein (UPF0335 family)